MKKEKRRMTEETMVINKQIFEFKRPARNHENDL